MKLSIAVPTIYPMKLRRFAISLKHMEGRVDYELILTYQEPVTRELCLELGAHKAIEFPRTPSDQPIPFVRLRSKAFEVAVGEYILWMDDDHTLVPAIAHRPSSGQFFEECLTYMDQNPDVGTLATAAYFGSAAWGNKVKKNPTSSNIPTDKGIIFRNIPELIPTDEEKSLVGFGEELIYIFKAMSAGYSHAKRFLNPTKQDPTKRRDGGNVSYTSEVYAANVEKYIRSKYKSPLWDSRKNKFPHKVLADQRKNRVQIT